MQANAFSFIARIPMGLGLTIAVALFAALWLFSAAPANGAGFPDGTGFNVVNGAGSVQAQVACDTSTQFVWDGGALTNSWTDAGNWDNDAAPNEVPGTGANVGVDVCIPNQTTDITITHVSLTHSIGAFLSDEALEISGGTLNIGGASEINSALTVSGGIRGGLGTIDVSGETTFTGGDMEREGITNANGGLSITGGNPKIIRFGHTLHNAGDGVWADSGSLTIRDAGILSNSGTFDVQNDQTVVGIGVGPKIINSGTFIKSAGSGVTQVNAGFNNNGTVTVQSGTLRYTSSYTQTSGATLLSGGDIATTTTLNIQGGILGGGGTVTLVTSSRRMAARSLRAFLRACLISSAITRRHQPAQLILRLGDLPRGQSSTGLM